MLTYNILYIIIPKIYCSTHLLLFILYIIKRLVFYRNLFFRTSNLLLIGAIPIFVLEGEAPQLKQAIIKKRINVNNNKVPTNNIVRKRLNLLQKQVSVNYIT